MINIIWGVFIIIGIIYSFINNDIDGLNNVILNSGKNGLNMVVQIFPVMAVWLGLMNIANKSGLLDKIAKLFSPLLRHLFPDIPYNHESLGYIASNVAINMFGLGNAATPFGLKAMKSLQTLNYKKDTASKSMITFLILNTSGLTIVPTTIISLRMMHNSTNPSSIVLACIFATISSTLFGLIIDRCLARRYKK